MARKVGLSTADVVAAAVEIADQQGLNKVTLAKVADRLGIQSPSLYTHVEGMAGLRRALQLHAARELTTSFRKSIAHRDGVEALRAIAHAYREFAVDHHGLFDSLLPAPKPGEDDEIYTALAEPAMIVADIVTSLGVASDQVIPTVRALRATVHGFTVLEHSGGFGMPHDIDASFENTLDLILTPLAHSPR